MATEKIAAFHWANDRFAAANGIVGGGELFLPEDFAFAIACNSGRTGLLAVNIS